MLKILQLILSGSEIGIQHSPTTGFQAAAKGPFAVAVLLVIAVVLGLAFLGR